MSFLKNIFAKKNEPIRSYEDFWTWFQKNEKAFFKVVKDKRDIEKNFFDQLSPKLNDVKEGIYYLTGMFDDHTVELVLSAEGTVANIVFVEELVNSAPKIDGWKFTALKPALDIADVNIEMSGYKFTEKNLHFYSNELPGYPDEIDISIVYDDFNEENKGTMINGVYIFLDNYLGEMNFATTIDNLSVIGKNEAEKELIPIVKLKDFLIWREKEFIEKYEGIRHDTENDNYSGYEAELESGNVMLAVINTDLMQWESKASHPWFLNIEIKYDGRSSNGMPDDETYKLLEEIENNISDELKDFDGYLNLGRQTADNTREIYFACKEFRKPSKLLYKIQQHYSNSIEMSYEIYKDKYWRSLNRFGNTVD